MPRDRWIKRRAFVMAAIGSAVGLGNVWRFPYMAYSNGGGAFFIPYLIALLTTGIPLLALEYYLGIRYQKGPTEVFGLLRKKSNFIGWFSIFSCAMIICYYTVVMSWAFNYMFHAIGVKWATNPQTFFYTQVLGMPGEISLFAGIQWPIVLGNLLMWIGMFLIVSKGVKRIGQVIDWFVIAPWILLFILLVRGVTLPGAGKGLDFYLAPDFALLLKPEVWLAAYGQIFFSLSLGFGIMIAYASYMPPEADINANAWVVAFANCLTSFFAGFAVFSAIGYIAFSTGHPIDTVVGDGPGLAFVVYPTAIAKLPGGILMQSVFGLIFFLMLLFLGIDSAFSLVEAIVTSFRDSFAWDRTRVTFWVCLAGCGIGMLYATSTGIHWLHIVDHWMNWSLILVGLLQAVFLGWFFDIRQIGKEMDAASELKLGCFWWIAVKYITPVALILILFSNILKEFQAPFGDYPIWALMCGGWGLTLSLFFAALYVQSRKEIPRMVDRHARLVGWSIIYIGLLSAFYLMYSAKSIVSPLIMAGGTLAIGGTLVFAINRLNLPLTAEKEDR